MAWTAASSQPSKKWSAPSTDSSSTRPPPATSASRRRTLWSCGAIVSAVPCWSRNGGASRPDLRRRAGGTGLIEPLADRAAEEVGGERRRIVGIERREVGQRVPARRPANRARLGGEADGGGEEAAGRLAPHDDAGWITTELPACARVQASASVVSSNGRRVRRLAAEAVVVGDHDETGVDDPLEEAGRPRARLARRPLPAAHPPATAMDVQHDRQRIRGRRRVGARRARAPGSPPSRRR